MKKTTTLRTKNKKTKPSPILISGSLCFDEIGTIHGTLRQLISIENGILQKQNIMSVANETKTYFGGTAGNIAYGVTKLGLTPRVFGVVGSDFEVYKTYLTKKGVCLHTKTSTKPTPRFLGLKDENGEQLGVFFPHAYGEIEQTSLPKYVSLQELNAIEIAIFSPGTAKSIVRHIKEFRRVNKTATVILDPGQMLAIDFTKTLLEQALRLSNILILNDTEANILHDKHELNLQSVHSLGCSLVIETKGKDGVSAYTQEGSGWNEIQVKLPEAKKVLDPTGAGDAFRAGFIKALLEQKTLKQALTEGAKQGKLCVEQKGGQTY